MKKIRSWIGRLLATWAYKRATSAAEVLCMYMDLIEAPNGLLIDLPERGAHVNVHRYSGETIIQSLIAYQKENSQMREQITALERGVEL